MTANGAPQRTGFIPEIQGLRTVALLLVAVYHIWFDRVSGGVDVFLLVSAYLMTRSLTGRAERGERTNPLAFAVQKFARLLPAAAVTTALVLVAVALLFPATMWRDHVVDAVASLTYTENLRLQQAGTDYFATNDALASPFQHFWSLSIQGQVFVMWALVHAGAELAARAARIPVRRVLLGVFGVVLAASLAWSIVLTAADQTFAYFDTWARLWEFAAGSLLALVQHWIRLPAALRAALGWIGVAGILACGWVLPVESSFPGYAALWPVVSAALIIISAGAPTRFGADRLLARPVLARIGDYTYALYLTHWPILVGFLVVTGAARPNWWQGLLILALSAAASAAIHLLAERPSSRWLAALRPPRSPRLDRSRSRWFRPATVVAATLALGLGASAALHQLTTLRATDSEQALAAADYSALGANAVPGAFDGEPPLQDESVVGDDWIIPGEYCAGDDPHRTPLCYEARPTAGDAPERTVLIIGNSHSTQLSGTLLETVARHPTWLLRTQVSPGCNFQFANQEDAPDGCRALWRAVEEYIADERPDMVVVHATWSYFDGDVTMTGLPEWVAEMRERSPGTVFVGMRDNPRLDLDPLECGLTHGFEAPQCVGAYVPGDVAGYRAEFEAAGGIWVDINAGVCDGTRCPAIRGGVVTYFDDNHLTGSYARTLAQRFADAIAPRVDWWPADAYEGEYVERAPIDLDVVGDLNK